MPFADANRAQIRVIEEVTWGTTPASGDTREVRLTSSSLVANKETVVSDELRDDRMVSDVVEVAASSGGDINFEWSSGPQDEFLAAFLLAQWTKPMSMDFWEGVQVTIGSTSTVVVTGTDLTGYLTAGRKIKLEGFTSTANNGYFDIASVAFGAGDTTITTTETTLVVESGSVNTKLYDANDVLFYLDTTFSSTATGFTSSLGTKFDAAISAGQLFVGQKVYAELGTELGTLVVSGTLSTAGHTITDGVASLTVLAGTDYTVGVDANTDALALAAAINAGAITNSVSLQVSADTGTVTIRNLLTTGGTITEDTVDANLVTTDFANGGAGLSQVYTITAVTSATITTSPAPAVVVAAGTYFTLKGSSVKNFGAITDINQREFTIETLFNDISQFQIQDGMVPGTFSLEIASGAIVTGTIGFEGRSTALAQTATLTGGGYTVLDAQPGQVVNATTDVADLTKDGATLGACIQSLSISGEAGLRQQSCVGSKFPQGIGTGRFNLTGSMTVFFEDEVLFNNFINHDTISLSWSVTDAEGMSYFFTLPAIKISQDQIAPGGIDQDVFDNIEFMAFRDSTSDTMFQIDRFSPTTIV